MIVIPGSDDQVWTAIITSHEVPQIKFLAARLIIGRLHYNYKNDPTPEKLKECSNELWAFFEKNKNINLASEDLEIILKNARLNAEGGQQ